MKNGGPSVSPQAAKILIVDDERDLMEMLAFACKKGNIKPSAPMTGWKPGENTIGET